MKRLLYIAILSMMAMTIWAPTALAQQSGGLCPGAVPVTSLSGSAADGEVESEPFDISTDLFQVAVDNTSNSPAGEGSTSLDVRDDLSLAVERGFFGDGEDGIVNAPNTGNGPFYLDVNAELQAYDIIVYECPQGPGPGGDGNGEGTTPEGTTPEEPPEGTTPNDNGEVQYEQPPEEPTTVVPPEQPPEEPTTVVPPEEPPNGEVPPGQPPGDVPPGGGNGGGGGQTGGDQTGGGIPVLPDTGGASLLALGAGALLVAGGLVARRILR